LNGQPSARDHLRRGAASRTPERARDAAGIDPYRAREPARSRRIAEDRSCELRAPGRRAADGGAEEVVAAIERRDGSEYSGLALNEKGYKRLVDAGLDRVNFTLAVLADTIGVRDAAPGS
jgi:hypothetical protein